MVVRLVTVVGYFEPAPAHLAVNRLAREGIEGYLIDEYMVGNLWLYATSVGGVKVQVKTCDLAKAQEVLNIQSSEGEMETREQSTPRCPECNCEVVHIKVDKVRSFLWIVSMILLTFITLALIWIFIGLWKSQVKQWECEECGYTWWQRKTAFPN